MEESDDRYPKDDFKPECDNLQAMLKSEKAR